MIPREVIEEIKSRLDIVDVISEYINLERVGQYYRALCPFHTETRPSFYVSPKLQRYKCFGCGASGDVIKFVQEMENISFYEAVEKLAKRVGIDVSKYMKGSGRSDYSEYVSFHETLKELYRESLRKSKEALDYLKESRGFSEEDIVRFEMGFSPKNSGFPLRVAEKLSVPESKLLKMGCVTKTREGFRDIFEGRIVLPIKNESGHTVAFGGRVIGEGEPKYLNSRDTRYFSKSRILFLLDVAKPKIRSLDFVIVTEGYFDAIAFHKAGFENTVAVLGTALTQHHSSRLSTITKSVVLAFDSDESGMRAMLRSLETLLARGFDVLVVDYGDYKDADETYQKLGKKGLEEALEKAIPYEKFIVEYFSKAFDLSTPSGLEKFARAISGWGKTIASLIGGARVRSLIRYASEKSGLEERDIERFIKAKTNVTISKGSSLGVEEVLAFLFFNNEELRDEIAGIDEEFLGSKMKEIIKLYRETGDLNKVVDELSKDTEDWIFSVLKDTPPPSNAKKALDDIKRKLKIQKLKERIKEIDDMLNEVNGEEKRVLLQARMEVLKEMQALQRG